MKIINDLILCYFVCVSAVFIVCFIIGAVLSFKDWLKERSKK